MLTLEIKIGKLDLTYWKHSNHMLMLFYMQSEQFWLRNTRLVNRICLFEKFYTTCRCCIIWDWSSVDSGLWDWWTGSHSPKTLHITCRKLRLLYRIWTTENSLMLSYMRLEQFWLRKTKLVNWIWLFENFYITCWCFLICYRSSVDSGAWDW